jgi:hypothetical protein
MSARLRLVSDPEWTECRHCDETYDRENCGYDEEYCSEQCMDAHHSSTCEDDNHAN